MCNFLTNYIFQYFFFPLFPLCLPLSRSPQVAIAVFHHIYIVYLHGDVLCVSEWMCNKSTQCGIDDAYTRVNNRGTNRTTRSFENSRRCIVSGWIAQCGTLWRTFSASTAISSIVTVASIWNVSRFPFSGACKCFCFSRSHFFHCCCLVFVNAYGVSRTHSTHNFSQFLDRNWSPCGGVQGGVTAASMISNNAH